MSENQCSYGEQHSIKVPWEFIVDDSKNEKGVNVSIGAVFQDVN